MYTFSFAESVSANTMLVTRGLFFEVMKRPEIRNICDEIARTEDPAVTGRLKRRLPAFCWHAWFEGGKRKNYKARSSGLIMIDMDHVDDPVKRYNEIAARAIALGLVAAHVTPSAHGLRLVFPVPEGMNLEEAQTYYARQLGVQVDSCTKDLARLSFCVPESYWLHIDEKRLFEGEAETPQPAVVDKPQEPSPAVQAENRSRATYPETYDDIPYARLVESLEELLGGAPAHGSRNNFIFTMAAYLRYVCNDEAEWIARILPNYGEASEKWRRTIESACQRAQHRQMPQVVHRAIDNARRRMSQGGTAGQPALPPEMPEVLPPIIAHLVKNVPEVCRPSVANGVFPALATHLKDTRFWLPDGTEKEPTMMCVNIARQSSGKSSINKPVEYILADIIERDNMSRRREQEWKDAINQKGANKEKPKRPDDICVQVISSDMTNAALTQRAKDAGTRYLYTNLEELELIKQLQTNGTKDVGKIICLCFDNGYLGQERVGAQSITQRIRLRWNWNASSTVQKGIQFFKGRLVDGTLSRINFCTIFPDKTKPFVYGRYDEEYAEVLKPWITNLNLANGNIECREALELALQLQDEVMERAALMDDDILADLGPRAVTIAYLKSMVLFICNDREWTEEIAAFTRWSLEYDLFCKKYFFESQMQTENAAECVKAVRGRKNLLDLLPDIFSVEQADEVRRQQGMPGNSQQMLRTWVFRGYIVRDELTMKYVKTDDYLKRSVTVTTLQ